MENYRVNLDVYNGPLDLLLYLIRREEVDIYDIPIARVTEQYCQYVEMIRQIDPNLAGEFLVMAATLIESKTRMLLPTPPSEEASAEQDLGDPRAELVRQLLQYKAFKDAAVALRDAGDQQATRHPRQPVRPDFELPELDLENIQVWHLLDAFSKMMAAIGKARATHDVVYDDTPIALHAEDILDRLRSQGAMTFGEVFVGRQGRSEIVGLFLAMLELVRNKRIVVQQEKVFGEIYLHLQTGSADPEQPQSEPSMIGLNDPNELMETEAFEVSQRGSLLTAAGAAMERADRPVGADEPKYVFRDQDEKEGEDSEDQEDDEDLEEEEDEDDEI